MKRSALLLLTLSMIALVAVACSSSTGAPPSGAGGSLIVKDAWARPGIVGADTAVYFTIVNGNAADTLTAVKTDVAAEAGIHRTATDASGMTGMQMAGPVAVPGGGTVQFAPGGYHVMLTGLKRALTVGDRVQLVLTFQNAGSLTVTAEVRAN